MSELKSPHSVLRKWVHRGAALACLFGLTLPLLAQEFSPPFEKQGRFIAPDQGLSLGRVHQSAGSYEGPQPFDVLHYKLDLTLSMVTAELAGKMTITMKLKAAVDSIELHAVSLSLDTVKVDGLLKGVTLNPSAETFAIHLGGLRGTGDTLQIEITYSRDLNIPRPSSRQGYYFFRDSIPANLGYTMSEPSDARFWMPCYDEPWEKATAEISITVPEGYVAASNGRLIGTKANGNGTTTWRWHERNQITTYLMCVTTSAFTISTIPYVRSGNDTIPVQYYTWSVDSAVAHAYLPTVNAMLELYERFFGEYPFDKYGMTSIIPFTYAGMEHQTLTTMNRFFQTSHRVVSHELAHQWWGNLVTCGTWPDIWLNEGFATYSEALWREHLGGFPALKSYMEDTLRGFQFGSWQGAVYNPVGQGFNLFSPVVYSKGAWVLHTLRGVVGDSVFFRILRAYRDGFVGSSAVTAEFASVVDSVVGSDMSWFFDQWVFGPGWPRYASDFRWSGDSLSLTVYQQQQSHWPTYKMPMRVRAYGPGTDTTFVVWDSLRTQTFRIPLAFQPDSVKLDPDGWILKQIVQPPVSVGEKDLPSAFELSQNFPNPFNPSTTILYRINERSHVSLKVFDLLGREVATLADGVRESGTHVATFDGSRLASGTYLYKLQVAGGMVSKRMIMLK